MLRCLMTLPFILCLSGCSTNWVTILQDINIGVQIATPVIDTLLPPQQAILLNWLSEAENVVIVCSTSSGTTLQKSQTCLSQAQTLISTIPFTNNQTILNAIQKIVTVAKNIIAAIGNNPVATTVAARVNKTSAMEPVRKQAMDQNAIIHTKLRGMNSR